MCLPLPFLVREPDLDPDLGPEPDPPPILAIWRATGGVSGLYCSPSTVVSGIFELEFLVFVFDLDFEWLPRPLLVPVSVLLGLDRVRRPPPDALALTMAVFRKSCL